MLFLYIFYTFYLLLVVYYYIGIYYPSSHGLKLNYLSIGFRLTAIYVGWKNKLETPQ